jgi:hypothetical protein
VNEPLPFEAFQARAVLEDCRIALLELRADPRGVQWRLRWCAVLALLRTVGHVLSKVDASSTSIAPEFRDEAARWWKELNRTKPEPLIFWEFIEKDRNALLKEYQFSAEQGIILRGDLNTVPLGALPLGASVAEPTYLMKDGPFAGRDQRDVVQEAIDWWDDQLEEIAVRAAATVTEPRLDPPEKE